MAWAPPSSLTILLIRVGADVTEAGGRWNGVVDSATREFVYAPIVEPRPFQPGLETPYSMLIPALRSFGRELPPRLASMHMHLDPDFCHLTYGDSNRKAAQIRGKLGVGDRAVFYAALRDVRGAPRLVYAIIGIFEVQQLVAPTAIAPEQRHINAHSRRLDPDPDDVVIIGRTGTSGRLERCIPIGEYRDRSYRVRRDLLDAWGGLSVRDGYLQRSAQLASFLDPLRFLAWFDAQSPSLIPANNP